MINLLQKKTNEGVPILYAAAAHGRVDVLQWFFVDALENVKAKAFKLLQKKDNRGWHVLHFAADKGLLAILKWSLVDAPENIKKLLLGSSLEKNTEDKTFIDLLDSKQEPVKVLLLKVTIEKISH